MEKNPGREKIEKKSVWMLKEIVGRLWGSVPAYLEGVEAKHGSISKLEPSSLAQSQGLLVLKDTCQCALNRPPGHLANI